MNFLEAADVIKSKQSHCAFNTRTKGPAKELFESEKVILFDYQPDLHLLEHLPSWYHLLCSD